MSRIRRTRTKSEAVVITAGAILGLVCLAGIAATLAYANTRATGAAPPAQPTQFSLTANDSGKTFAYATGSRFTVFLDEAHYPQADLACAPAGIIGSISSLGVAPPGLWDARFETVASGSCILTDKNFSVTIVVVR